MISVELGEIEMIRRTAPGFVVGDAPGCLLQPATPNAASAIRIAEARSGRSAPDSQGRFVTRWIVAANGSQHNQPGRIRYGHGVYRNSIRAARSRDMPF